MRKLGAAPTLDSLGLSADHIQVDEMDDPDVRKVIEAIMLEVRAVVRPCGRDRARAPPQHPAPASCLPHPRLQAPLIIARSPPPPPPHTHARARARRVAAAAFGGA